MSDADLKVEAQDLAYVSGPLASASTPPVPMLTVRILRRYGVKPVCTLRD